MRRGARDIALIGIVSALSFVLDLFGWTTAGYGRISLASVPVLALALTEGWMTGMLAGALAGYLHYFQQYVAAHPLSLLLDYPLASACLGIAGFFRAQGAQPRQVFRLSFVGVAVAVMAKYSVHVISGVIYWAQGLSGAAAWQLSAYTNLTYMGPQLLLDLALVPPLSVRLHKIRGTRRSP